MKQEKKVSRSSKSGRFVTRKYASKHKATTQSEKISSRKSIIKYLVIGDPGTDHVDLVLTFFHPFEKMLYKSSESSRINKESPTVFDTRRGANNAIVRSKKDIKKFKMPWKGNYKVIPIKVNI